VLLAGAADTPLQAQDTTAAAPLDTAAPPGDAAPADSVPADSVPADSAPALGPPAGTVQDTPRTGQDGMRPDTLAPDTLRPDTTAASSRPPGAAAPDTASPAVPPAPVDSALAIACRESGGDPPDLLMVKFRATATAAEREKVARDVGGTLVEQSQHQAPGAWYLHVPGSGMNPLVADRLILMPDVLEVGATRCPS
jgi:hypothetical protein